MPFRTPAPRGGASGGVVKALSQRIGPPHQILRACCVHPTVRSARTCCVSGRLSRLSRPLSLVLPHSAPPQSRPARRPRSNIAAISKMATAAAGGTTAVGARKGSHWRRCDSPLPSRESGLTWCDRRTRPPPPRSQVCISSNYAFRRPARIRRNSHRGCAFVVWTLLDRRPWIANRTP